MAMLDYGVVLKKNGIVLHRDDLFMNMQKAVGFTIDKLQDKDNEEYIYQINGNYFVYIGDKEMLICVYKTQLLIISNNEIIHRVYGANIDSYSMHDKFRLKFEVNGVKLDIKRISYGNMYLFRYWYKGNLYECIYGYGVDNSIKEWYYNDSRERRIAKEFFKDKPWKGIIIV